MYDNLGQRLPSGHLLCASCPVCKMGRNHPYSCCKDSVGDAHKRPGAQGKLRCCWVLVMASGVPATRQDQVPTGQKADEDFLAKCEAATYRCNGRGCSDPFGTERKSKGTPHLAHTVLKLGPEGPQPEAGHTLPAHTDAEWAHVAHPVPSLGPTRPASSRSPHLSVPRRPPQSPPQMRHCPEPPTRKSSEARCPGL